jgi:hypothetical protein
MNYSRRKVNDVKIYKESKAYNGYTFFATMYGKDAWLIDMEGNVVHNWKMKQMPGPYGKLLENGNVLWQGRGIDAIEGFGGNATELVEVDWEGNEVWRYDDPFLNHGFLRMKNGNTLINRYIEIPKDIAAKVKGGVAGTELDGKIYGCSFQEITPEKEVVWEWKHYEHMDVETDILCPLCPRSIWGYTNAMDIMPDGNLVFTLRYLNTVVIIDRKTGEIIWRWGPKHSIGHPHDCTALPNGNILLFDNGFHRKPYVCSDDDDLEVSPAGISEEEYSAILEINPKTNEIVWDFRDRLNLFYTNVCGGAQRLPNGNTLVCESTKGRFFEVTPEKEIVWEYINPFMTNHPPYWNYDWQPTAETFRAFRFGPDFPGLEGKDLNPKNYEWSVLPREEKSEEEKEEEAILSRLTKLGY